MNLKFLRKIKNRFLYFYTMKKICFLLFVLISFLFSSKAKTFTFSGKIPAISNETVRLQYYATPFQTEINEALFAVNSKGIFKMKADFWEGQIVTLLSSKIVIRFFAGANDSLYVILKKEKGKEKYVFSGTGSAAANFTIKQNEHFINSLESPSFSLEVITQMTNRNAADFKKYCDSLSAIKIKYLKQNKSILPESFYQWQLAENIFQFENIKINYPEWYYTMRGIENKRLEVDSDYYSFLKNIEVNNDKFIYSPEYRYFLKYYFLNQFNGSRQRPNAIQAYDFSANYFTGKALKIFQLQVWHEVIQFGNFNDATTIYMKADKQYGDQPEFKYLLTIYNEKRPFSVGSKAPEFTLPDLNGMKVSLQSFLGKIVYLDFWASWCRPCLAEIPASEKLKKYFEGKEVVFINISIDEDEAAWRMSQEKNQISGINLLCKNNESNMAKKYQVSTIPSYFLIDKKGNFIAAPAQRPGNEIIYKQIEDALQK